MNIVPFNALRPLPEAAARMASVPYDVVNRHEARMLAAGNPDHFLHVIRPEIDFPDTVAEDAPQVYQRARETFLDWQRRGLLVREGVARYYAYRQVMGDHAQIGLVAGFQIDDYAAGTIRLHEKTRRDKENDRTRHILSVRANTGPVFLMCREAPLQADLLAGVVAETPLFDFTAPDQVRHTLWPIPVAVAAELRDTLEAIPAVYVADGHHRAAAAYRAGCTLREQKPKAQADAPFNTFMGVLFAASDLQVLPYNRVVRDLNGLTPETFLAKIAESFEFEPLDAHAAPTRAGEAGMRLNTRWYRLRWSPPTDGPPETRLDVAVLQHRLLQPVLGIDDPRADTRIAFVGGIRGVNELERLTDSGQAAVAFSMHPVTVDQIMDVADAGRTLPPKSTWFEPKLRSGLLVHSLDAL